MTLVLIVDDVLATGGKMQGWRRFRLGVVVLSCVLAAACTSQQREQPAPTSRSAAVPAQRGYWPTAGWRTAPPAQVGMDPKILAVLDTNVAYHPQLRSLLVVRQVASRLVVSVAREGCR